MTLITPKKSLPLPENIPSLAEVEANYIKLRPFIHQTPLIQMPMPQVPLCQAKMELWQKTGTFKARSALSWINRLSPQDRKKGVIAASAGNHAIAVSYAAKTFAVNAKVVMPKNASPFRVKQCQASGAKIIFADFVAEVFDLLAQEQARDPRVLIHPFDGPEVTLGAGSLGLELFKQAPDLECIIASVGGGGLISSLAYVYKLLNPNCQIYGVEPEGAPTISQSFQTGKPQALKHIESIADSLSAPMSLPYSLAICMQCLDGMVTVTDAQIKQSMQDIFEQQKLALEPAAAAAFAGLAGPLKQLTSGKKVCVIVCGTNIDTTRFCQWVNSRE